MTNPRYDEQFRRGYDGPPVPPPTPSSLEAGASRPGPDAPRRLHDDGPGGRAPAGEDRAVDESFEVHAADAVQSDIATAPPFRRNPFAIALLALGVLTLIVGVWLAEQSTKLGTDGTPEQQAVAQVAWQMATPVLTCGVIAIVAWLVLGAFVVTGHRRGT